MTITRLLIANRGEIAIRIARAAAELGIETVGIYPADDGASLHIRKVDDAVRLDGAGAAAYLDGAQILRVAQDRGCDALHPGYGFLSENAVFARACAQAGVTFVGPSPETLALFGDKARARQLAAETSVPVLRGTNHTTSLDEARRFLSALGPSGAMMIKALSGGGGRGMRIVTSTDDIDAAYESCQREAEKAFGDGAVYVEELIPRARHIEVQILGDDRGHVSHLGERDCTLQRRHQKLVEIAPSPGLAEGLRARLTDAAVVMARAASVRSLCTMEFLVQADDLKSTSGFAFIEANPRLQVEHTVTEEVTGVDLVKTQLHLAAGRTLQELGLQQTRAPRPCGYAIQMRINAETIGPDGTAHPSSGTLRTFDIPMGPGLRCDTAAYTGYQNHPGFDSLLAKLIAFSSSPDFSAVLTRAYRALCETRIEGLETTLPLLQALLRHPDVAANKVTTRFLEEHGAALLSDTQRHRRLYFETAPDGLSGAGGPVGEMTGPPGTDALRAPMLGTVVNIEVAEGDTVRKGQPLLIMDAMKMEHVIGAESAGIVRALAVSTGATVREGQALAFIEPQETDDLGAEEADAADLDHIRPDLAESLERHALGFDDARPEAVAKRRKTGSRTARENIEDLCDPGSFAEYGALAIAAQRRRRSLDDLVRNTAGDGMVTGLGEINGAQFGPARAQCVVMSYDYMVLAGTQGFQNHRKKDRMFEIAEERKLPVVLFTEGGGGRPGDTDAPGVAGLDCLAFEMFGALSGHVPLVGIVSGRCFAGNAALLGCCDVVIATENSTIGMGGPAMIEGGGLGVFRPEEVGPIADQVPNGVVDIPVKDEAEAVAAAKRYLSYFQGSLTEWECVDQRHLRHLIPENRLRIYDVRKVIEALADTDSVLELRKGFGHGMVTAFIRVEGRALGLIANNPAHLAGAIDSDGADKASRFMQLCDAFDVPILFLCDTPGIMVGPEAEKSGTVRHAARMFVTGASLTVPFFTVILRKGYGLGAQAMAGGSFKAPVFCVSWPTGEFGGMGLEGAVRLGYRKELEAVEDPAERQILFEQMVARAYEHGKGLNMAAHFEIDDVIDPAETRALIVKGLRSAPLPGWGKGKRPCIDTW